MKKGKEKRVFTIRLTITSIILWSIVFLVIIGWAFLLGILAGAGFFSEDVELVNPKTEHVKEVENEEKALKFSYHKMLTSKPKEIASPDLCYSVQVVAYRKEENAIRFVRKLKKWGYSAYYIKSVKNGKTYYKVRCGRLRERRDAEILKERIFKRLHISGMIVRCE